MWAKLEVGEARHGEANGEVEVTEGTRIISGGRARGDDCLRDYENIKLYTTVLNKFMSCDRCFFVLRNFFSFFTPDR